MGISHFQTPRQLSLFFAIREENFLDRPDIELSYLSLKGWRKFAKNQLLSDTTNGIRQTGIMTLNFPADAINNADNMPKHFHWIKIETPKDPELFDRILTVRTNAVICNLDEATIDPHYQVNRLAPKTISSLAIKKSQIKRIEQPYPSFGGTPIETNTAFFTRVSEQLAHKDRAISSWDVEHLILQNFDEIYQVICNPHTNKYGEEASGFFNVLVIAKIEQRFDKEIRIPLVPAALLARVQNFLQSRISSHVELSVINPTYEVIHINAVVGFVGKADEGYQIKELESALKSFLSPWAFNTKYQLEMGTVLYKSSIIKFIELQPYIDFIAQIHVYKNDVLVKKDEIMTLKHSILISANSHHIETVDPNSLLCQTNQGISQMIVDINFQVE